MSSTRDKVDTEHVPLLKDIVLHENDLTEEAKIRFKYHGEILRGFELYQQSIVSNNYLTYRGRHLLLSTIYRMHTLCKQVLNYVTENSKILNDDLPNNGPLVICGLPRTGTTLLYNLLACDPNCRALLYTEMYTESVPPIARSNLIEQQRRTTMVELAAQRIGQLPGQTSEILASHPRFAYEEDLGLLKHASVFALNMMIITTDDENNIDDYLQAEMEKEFAYDYHKIFLQMSNSVDAPRSHWLLKSFFHVFCLDILRQHYPRAAVVMTHRRLEEVFPSYLRLFLTLANFYYDKANLTSQQILKTRALQFIDRMIKRIVEFRKLQYQHSDQWGKNTLDVNYNDLMEQPIAIVRRIYDYFGFRWSDEFQAAMNTWLLENPQGKYGRHTYSLEEFGLSSEDIQKQYADYVQMFLQPISSNAAGNDLLISENK